MTHSPSLRSCSCTRWFGSFVLLVAFVGCSGQPVAQPQDPGTLNELSRVYLAATVGLDRAPTSPQELQPYLPPGKTVDELLTSSNDRQPYVVAWGADPRSGMDLKPLVIAYEKQGSNGSRFVFTAMGVMLMSNEDFKEARFPAGHTPQF